MGFIGLTSALSAYSTRVFLNPSTSSHHDPSHQEGKQWRFVVDGPAFVYHIYYRYFSYLLDASKPESSVLSNLLAAVPTYEALGRATVRYLDELGKYEGQEITRIFFDGGLPESKRATRLSRLRSGVRNLDWLHEIFPSQSDNLAHKAEMNPESSKDIPVEALFQPRPAPPSLYRLPPPPFLVFAVMQHLRSSHYGDRVVMASGEADAWCASTAKACGGTVLTTDSDLFAFDTGPRVTVALLRDIDWISCSCCGDGVNLSVMRPWSVAQTLGLGDSLARVAHEFDNSSGALFSVCVSRARNPPRDIAKWDLFRKKYTCFDATQDLGTRNLYELEARISELHLQLRQSNDSPIHMFLPILTEDPSRGSAWTMGEGLRKISYSFACKGSGSITRHIIREYKRRGLQIAATEQKVLHIRHALEFLSLYARWLWNFSLRCGGRSPSGTSIDFWKRVVIVEASYLYYDSQNNLTNEARERLNFLQDELQIDDWNQIHATAELHAAFYSLLMVKQTIALIRSSPAVQEIPVLADTEYEIFDDLPSVSEFFGKENRARGLYTTFSENAFINLFEERDALDSQVDMSKGETTTYKFGFGDTLQSSKTAAALKLSSQKGRKGRKAPTKRPRRSARLFM